MDIYCYVFDSSAIINSQYLTKIIEQKKAKIYIPINVLDELNSSIVKGKLEIIKEVHDVITVFPSKDYIDYVTHKCKKLGILSRISDVDLSVLAVLIEIKKRERCKKVILVTDDYWMQNFAMNEKISFKKAMFKGIRKVKKWAYKCEYCGRIYSSPDYEDCPVCGGPLKKVRTK